MTIEVIFKDVNYFIHKPQNFFAYGIGVNDGFLSLYDIDGNTIAQFNLSIVKYWCVIGTEIVGENDD